MVTRVATADTAAADLAVEPSPFDGLVAAVRYRLAGGGAEWTDRAACRGEDTAQFFPADTTRAATRAALTEVARFCERCPVHVDCLATAVIGSEVGLWAGTDDRQRAALTVRLRQVGVLLPGDGATVVSVCAPRTASGDRPPPRDHVPPPETSRDLAPVVSTGPTSSGATAVTPGGMAPPPNLAPLLDRLPGSDRWTLLVRLDCIADDALAAALEGVRSTSVGTEITARRRNDGAVDVFVKRCAA